MPTKHKTSYKSRTLSFIIVAVAIISCTSSLSLRVSAQAAAPKTPLTHETMWAMKRVGAPSPSPDGKWVVFSLVEPAYDEKDQVSDLWIVHADGSAKSRRLTFSKGGESGVVWSPDSQRLAFSAKREGDDVSQIYVLDIADGGEALRVTSVSTGARSPQWRLDGKALLFTSTVFPGALDEEANKKMAAERKALKYRARVYEKFPIRNWDKWVEDLQAHLFVQSLAPDAKAKDLLAGTRLVAQRGFAGRVQDSGEELDAIWTPDGDSIIFVATTNRDTAAYSTTNSALFKVSFGGGEPVQLTTGADSFSRPVFR